MTTIKQAIKTITRNLNQDVGKVRASMCVIATLVNHPTMNYAWHPDCLTPANIQRILNVGEDLLEHWDEYVEDGTSDECIDTILCSFHDRYTI